MSSRMQIVEGKTPIISGVFQRWLNGIYAKVSGIEFGTYTPTITILENVSYAGAATANYFKVGNNITVTGSMSLRFDYDGEFLINISLPIKSNITNYNECCGVAISRYLDVAKITTDFLYNDYVPLVIGRVLGSTNIYPVAFNFTYILI